MQAYLVRRILAVFPILLVVAVLVFVLLRVIPGDAARSIVGVEATIEDVTAVRETLGLNEPMAVQFFKWFGNVLKGDFGMSFVSNTSVMSEIVKKARPDDLHHPTDGASGDHHSRAYGRPGGLESRQ